MNDQKFLTEFIDGGPGCMRDDCNVSLISGQVTMAYYPPTFDSLGRNNNPDMNVSTNTKHCLSCGKQWSERWQNGQRID